VKTEDFSFDLPEDLIAQFPPERRGESRLMLLDRASGKIRHSMVAELPLFVEPGTLMVLNDSRVRKARIYGNTLDTGSCVEFLLLKRRSASVWETAATKLRKQVPGRRYAFPEGVEAEVLPPDASLPRIDSSNNRDNPSTILLRFFPSIDDVWLDRVGHIPLPPYIRREDGVTDADRYQTVYARSVGSAASPTAGLHFTEEILAALRSRGVLTATVTLHVGLGTFLPVRVENLEEHLMHSEAYSVSEETARLVMAAKADGRPILAVGTTSLRSLESAWRLEDADGPEGIRPGEAETRIFIYPGYHFKVVDRLFTNFHTPKSTLLMLASAFAGRERIMEAYAEALQRRYRFFSYGDAMLIG
jgi:S-adenosylmethionine:tRNA ribosyltransferase-isomerase